MKKEKLTKLNRLSVLEARDEFLDVARGRFSTWLVEEEEEKSVMRTLLDAIDEYIDYLEENLAKFEEEENN